jgi:hypothetical protein
LASMENFFALHNAFSHFLSPCCIDRINPSAWLAMSANVSVGYTPQTTDICICRRHVGNVVPTRRRHSVMSANFSAVSVMSVRPIANTHSYMYVGISIDEAVTTYEDKKKLHPLRFCIHSQVLTLSKSK